jgi:hypothetical protein
MSPARTGSLPADANVSEGYLVLERSQEFRGCWLNVGRLDHLEEWPGEDMPPPAHRRFLMSLSLVEIVPLIEQYTTCEVIDACDPRRFVPQP